MALKIIEGFPIHRNENNKNNRDIIIRCYVRTYGGSRQIYLSLRHTEKHPDTRKNIQKREISF